MREEAIIGERRVVVMVMERGFRSHVVDLGFSSHVERAIVTPRFPMIASNVERRATEAIDAQCGDGTEAAKTRVPLKLAPLAKNPDPGSSF